MPPHTEHWLGLLALPRASPSNRFATPSSRFSTAFLLIPIASRPCFCSVFALPLILSHRLPYCNLSITHNLKRLPRSSGKVIFPVRTHRTAAWKRLRDLEAYGANAELSIPNSGSRPSLAARWVDDGGDAGAGVRCVVGAPGGGCVCGPPPGTRAQGGGFTRDHGAWPPPCGLLCGDVGERRPGGQAVTPRCIEGASRHGRPAPVIAKGDLENTGQSISIAMWAMPLP